MKRVVVDDMFFLKGFAEIDAIIDDFVRDDEPLRWKELGTILQLIDLKLSP